MVTRSASSTRSGEGYPKAASSFAAVLGMSNLDIAAFVPLGCMAPEAGFYLKLQLKTLMPLGIIALLWVYPALTRATGGDSASATRLAAQWTLVGLKLVVSGVSTTIVTTFVCDEFENGYFLSDDLTLECDGSADRRGYLGFAAFMMLVYPLGKRRRSQSDAASLRPRTDLKTTPTGTLVLPPRPAPARDAQACRSSSSFSCTAFGRASRAS